MTIHRDATNGAQYRIALRNAWNTPKGAGVLGDSLTDYRADIPPEGGLQGARFYVDVVDESITGGFIVKASGELVGVFSAIKGRGEALVSAAVNSGASHLDCFDGYLTTLYGRHGFHVTGREANWTPGGPDVVYMTHGSAPAGLVNAPAMFSVVAETVVTL